MRIGTIAPDFQLPLHTGENFRLSAWKGRMNIVLVFYPKDFTSGCTKENCLFASHAKECESYDGLFVGINSDSIEVHQRFADEYRLPYALASDVNKNVCRAYDTLWPFGIAVKRITYIIDKEGIVRGKVHNELSMTRHWEYVLRVLRELRGEATSPLSAMS